MANLILKNNTNGGTTSVTADNFIGNASSATVSRFLRSEDTRNYVVEPQNMSASQAVHFDFKAASTIGLNDASFSGVMSYRPYSGESDWTGGPAHQLAFNNAGLYWRQSSGNAWLSWNKLIHSGNYTDYTVTKTGSGASGTWGINVTGTANLPAGFTIKHTSSTWGAISSSNYTLVTGWATNDDASIDFLCYPNRTELSVKIDGFFFQNEGQYKCFDVGGGSLVDGASLQFTGVGASVPAGTPTALSYGRLQAYGTLCINADTDVSGGEYVLLTAGKGLSVNNNDGLAIGQSTLTWQGATVITSGNIGSYSAGSTTTLASRWHHNTVTSPAPDCGLAYDSNMLQGTPGLFPVVHNGNGMITLSKHSGAYDSQLGFSGNGRIYYRNFNGSALNTTTGWNTIAFTSDTVAGANYASESGYAGVAGVVRGTYTGSGGAQGPNYIGRSNVRFNMMNAFSGGPVVNYMDCILMNTYGGGDVPRATGIGVERYSGHLWVAEGSDTSSTWAQVYKAWTSKNMRVGQGAPTHSAEYGDVYFQY